MLLYKSEEGKSFVMVQGQSWDIEEAILDLFREEEG
jgi:hypothetical protein